MKIRSGDLILLIESGVNIIYALIINGALLYLLDSHEYGVYAIGLTAAALASLTAIGLQALVPEFKAELVNIEDKIWQGIKFQGLLVLIYSILIALVPNTAIDSIFSKIEITKEIIIIAAFYFYAQSFDEATHVFLKTTSKPRLSLILTILSKLIILSVSLYFGIKCKDGAIVFKIMALCFFTTASIKILYLIYPKRESSTLTLTVLKKLSSDYFSMWLGNVSNALFNGAMRLAIGESQGAKIIGILAISSQIATAFSSFTGALTFNKVMHAWQTSKQFKELDKKMKSTFILSFLSSIICASTILVFMKYYFLQKNIILSSMEEGSILMIAISFSLSIFILPHYQVCQFYGKVRSVAKFNFVLALLGLVFLYAIENMFNANSGSLVIFMMVSIGSAILIFITYRSILVVKYQNQDVKFEKINQANK